jgi:Trk-type K+ transport system membrane component
MIRSIILRVLAITLVVEVIGFALLYPSVKHQFSGTYDSLFLTLFHTVSSFACAGFDVFGSGGLALLGGKSSFLMVSSFLMLVGVLGFPTVMELLSFKRKKTLFTKINGIVQFGFTLFGFLLFLALEFKGAFADLPWFHKGVHALFFAISARNTGIVNLPVTELSSAAFLFMLLLMFVGTSPGSTGGGIRTTTFFVLIAKCKSVVLGHSETTALKKTIPEEDVNKALVVTFGFITLLAVSICTLSLLEPFSLKAITLEVFSALTTAGISLGITADLSIASKSILILLMIIGRLGIFAMLYLFIRPKKTSVKYVKESVMIG